MIGFQYWMIGIIVILLVIRIILKNFKYVNLVTLIYSLLVNILLAWIIHNDQLSFERAFTFGYYESNSAIAITREIYLSYFLAIFFNVVTILILYLSKKNYSSTGKNISELLKKHIPIILILSSLSVLSSCGVFRAVGLYNVPPDYADTFKEVNGRDFINHNNITENLLVELTPLRYEYSPYETVRMRVTIFNVSKSDTMYIREPRMISWNYPDQGIVVTDSTGRRMRVLEYIPDADGVLITDTYGRKIKNTLAPDGYKLPPGKSTMNVIEFVCEKHNMTIAGDIKRENKPGYYTAYYTQPHEEYYRINGPMRTRLYSNKVHFKISDYTEEQVKVKEKVDEFMKAVNNKSSIQKIEDLFTAIKTEDPDSLYIPQIQKIIDTYNMIIVPRLKNE